MTHNGSVLGLLRKTLVIATKLSVPDVRGWVKAEIEGYESGATLPDYRIVPAHLQSENPYTGEWVHTQLIQDNRPFEPNLPPPPAPKLPIAQPIAQIEAWIESKSPGLRSYLSPELQEYNTLGWTSAWFISKSALTIIPDQIRNRVLNWSLELEDKGILGEGLTFSQHERFQATTLVANIYFYQNNGLVGALGDKATASDVRQGV